MWPLQLTNLTFSLGNCFLDKKIAMLIARKKVHTKFN